MLTLRQAGLAAACLQILLLLALLQPAPASADTTFVVNTSEDTNDGICDETHCSLRDAIVAANASPGTYTITFDDSLDGTPITLTIAGAGENASATGDLDIADGSHITVRGNGATNTIVQACSEPQMAGDCEDTGIADRVFHVASGGYLLLEGVTVRHGRDVSTAPNIEGGGGIYAEGDLEVVQSVVSDNRSQTMAGGIRTRGLLKVTGSTIANSSSLSSAAIDIGSSSEATIANTTISGNNTSSTAATVWVAGGTASFINVTLADNNVSAGDAIIYATGSGNVELTNTIVASGNENACITGGSATITGTNNLIDDASCGDIVDGVGGNITGVDPALGPLADNGGPTETHLPGATSDAIDNGDASTCAGDDVDGVDQRGVNRPQGAGCDIGAVEVEQAEPQTFVVNSNDDANDGTCDDTHCSLREAINAANVDPSDDTITFAANLDGETITLTDALPHLATDMTIEGPGADLLTVDADAPEDGTRRVFYIDGDADVTISGLAITGGRIAANGEGGGIFLDSGTLTLEDALVHDNGSDQRFTLGGGVVAGPGSTLVVNRSIFHDNFTGPGTSGGNAVYGLGASITLNDSVITPTAVREHVSFYGAVLITHSELAVNDSLIAGDTFLFQGEISRARAITAVGTNHIAITNSTITGRHAIVFHDEGGSLELTHSTVVGETIAILNGADAIALSARGTVISGYCESTTLVLAENNVADSASCAGLATVVDDLDLLPLGDYGGSTQTFALGPDSPALDIYAPDAGSCLVDTDQRGEARPQGVGCDAGAFELVIDYSFASSTIDFGELHVGDEASRTVEVTNEGPDTVTVSVSGGEPQGDDGFSFDGGCDGESLAEGESCTLTYRFHPTTTAGDRSATSTIELNGVEYEVELEGAALLPISLFTDMLDFGDVYVGETETLSVTVLNISPVAQALDIDVTGVAAPFAVQDGCDVATIENGASCTIEFSFSPTEVGSANATAVVHAYGEALEVDLQGTGIAIADLSITKESPRPPVLAGSTIRYDITVDNDGPTFAENVMVSDTTPVGSTFAGVSATGWTCATPAAGEAGDIDCTLDTLAAGAEATLTIFVRLDDDLAHGDTLTNTATGSSTTYDPDEENNSDSVTTTVGRRADLEVFAAVSHYRAEPGDQITYLVEVVNHGPNHAGTATLEFDIPDNATLVSFDAPASWTCDVPEPGEPGTVECAFDDPVGDLQDTPARLVLAVDDAAEDGDVVNVWFVADSDTADPAHLNNIAWRSVPIDADDDPGDPGPGDDDPVVYHLGFRWTLITWARVHGLTPAQTFADILESVTAIYTWDGDAWLGYFHGAENIPGVNQLRSIDYGLAYWVAIDEPAGIEWEVPGQPANE